MSMEYMIACTNPSKFTHAAVNFQAYGFSIRVLLFLEKISINLWLADTVCLIQSTNWMTWGADIVYGNFLRSRSLLYLRSCPNPKPMRFLSCSETFHVLKVHVKGLCTQTQKGLPLQSQQAVLWKQGSIWVQLELAGCGGGSLSVLFKGHKRS